MTRKLAPPLFPLPPREYSPQYMAGVVEAFSIFLRQYQNPGEGRNTFIVLTALQSHDQGLEPGAVFEVDGVLHVAVLYRAHVKGAAATATGGTVTVITA